MDAKEHKELLETYLWEAEEHLKTLNRGIIKLEKNPKDFSLISELFRAAHTLKGASRMMNVTPIRDVAHQLEEILELLRDNKIQYSVQLVDGILASLDFLSEVMEKAVAGELELPSAKNVCDQLIQLRKAWELPVSEAESSSSKIQVNNNQKESNQSIEEVHDQKNGDTSFSFQHFLNAAEEHIRVPLAQVDQLFNLTGGIVLNKVRAMYRSHLSSRTLLFRNLSLQLGFAEDRLRMLEKNIHDTLNYFLESSKTKSINVLESKPPQALELIQEIYSIEEMLSQSKSEVLRYSKELHLESFRLSSVIEELQQKMKEIRMVPCTLLFEGFTRLVRDVAKTQDKNIDLKIIGQETQLDKKVLEGIKASLIHLLLNAIVHGIEKSEERLKAGKPEKSVLTISAGQEGPKIVIKVIDDGRGIDLKKVTSLAVTRGLIREDQIDSLSEKEILDLLFEEGFSTSNQKTDLAGRGVGLNVVRTELRRLKGRLSIFTKSGKGTEFRLELPPTLAILRVLFFEVEGHRFALPMETVVRTVKIDESKFEFIENQRQVFIEKQYVPVFLFKNLLSFPKKNIQLQSRAKALNENLKTLILLNEDNKYFGILVDQVVEEEEVFVKPLDSYLEKIPGVFGATTLSSGEVVLIVNIDELIHIVPTLDKFSNVTTHDDEDKKTYNLGKILVVDDSMTARALEKNLLEKQGFEVDLAADGLEALEKLNTNKNSYRAVLSDIEMPNMSGLELVKSMKANKNLSSVPFIFITARTEHFEEGMKLGALGFFMKSQFNEAGLISMLETIR